MNNVRDASVGLAVYIHLQFSCLIISEIRQTRARRGDHDSVTVTRQDNDSYRYFIHSLTTNTQIYCVHFKIIP